MFSPADIPSGSDPDPWLTVAEFAEAMRVRPVTVRSWIAKGQLRATRAGQRKWLIRQAELSRMLEADTSDVPPPEAYDEMITLNADTTAQRAEHDELSAEYELHIALEQSRMAPPDARFPTRIRQIAMAAAWRAASIRERMNESGYAWKPVPNSAGMTLSYELRPGGNRPGPRDGWERFDRVVARLGKAMEGTSASAVAGALSDLAIAMNDLADAIENRPLAGTDAQAE
jgi:excisionase family DNA binding protein